MEVTERNHHVDPYEIHQENMQRLKVLTSMNNNSSRSAPNSPMLRRAIANDKLEGKKSNLLSPMMPHKDIKISEDSRSRSLTNIAKSDGTRSRSLSPSPHNLSPSESPVGSPMSVSERIIRTHYLSNTTGKPGSYLLKKSDDIIKHKGSPTGSPQMLASPNLERRHLSPNIPRKLPPLNNEGSAKMLAQIKPPAAIVISPATEEPSYRINQDRLFANQGQLTTAKKQSLNKKSKKDNLQNQDLSSVKVNRPQPMEEDFPLPITDVRKSIGDILSKPRPNEVFADSKEIPPTKDSVPKKLEPLVTNKDSKIKQKDTKPKKHRYIKYGNTNRSPGMLSPPTEPRGSKDLSAEMENMYKERERRVFEDLEHLEEVSVGTSDEDHGEHLSITSEELRASSAKNAPKVFTMPPVFDNIPAQLQVRDFSVPVSIEDLAVDEEEWEKMKQCRYLRVGENVEDEEEEDLNFSDDDDDENESEDDNQ